jgi:hypothetical protein
MGSRRHISLTVQGPPRCNEIARPRNNSASGQAVAKAMRIRLLVSMTRAAIFKSRSWIVLNSALARSWILGMASRTACISHMWTARSSQDISSVV